MFQNNNNNKKESTETSVLRTETSKENHQRSSTLCDLCTKSEYARYHVHCRKLKATIKNEQVI